MTAIVGGFASRRSQISVASRGGASGSTSATSSPASTTVEVTSGSQSSPSSQAGCCIRQIQSPAATSRASAPGLLMPGSVDGLARAPDRDLDARGATGLAALAEERAEDRLRIAVGPRATVVAADLLRDRLVRVAKQRPPLAPGRGSRALR